MIIRPTSLEDLYEIQCQVFEDDRGIFVKKFHYDTFEKNGLKTDFKESYYSVSKKNVLRGMHFQLPPHDHAKLVYVIQGEILDVALDIRRKSPTFGQCHKVVISGENAKSLYVGSGFAHGFLTLSCSATVAYLVTSVHSPEFDSGVCWDSFGFDWGVDSPVLSERDVGFRPFACLCDE